MSQPVGRENGSGRNPDESTRRSRYIWEKPDCCPVHDLIGRARPTASRRIAGFPFLSTTNERQIWGCVSRSNVEVPHRVFAEASAWSVRCHPTKLPQTKDPSGGTA